MINRFFASALFAIVCGILTTNNCHAQTEGDSQVIQDQQTDSKPARPLTTGPKDAQEKVAPGKIDEDASAEYITTSSGLKYRILRKSDKPKPEAGDTVTVHYKGWLSSDQKIFDSSYRRGETISFPLNRVIAGWTEGMQLVGVGGMIELAIPGNLAYGARGAPQAGIPPNAELTFIVELVEIK
jgi:FKBP-type peptidyl-prolyl cis-trans isomerase FkpA